MERLTDCAQGYCEMYCKKYTFCFEDPENCAFKNEIKLYDALKSIEGIVPFDRLLELADADRAGRLVVLPCKVVDTIDKLFSHNEIIALWYDKPGDKDHSYLLWRGEAWRLPDKYKGQMVLKFKGIIPEKISEADTINLQITPCEDTALAGKGGAK